MIEVREDGCFAEHNVQRRTQVFAAHSPILHLILCGIVTIAATAGASGQDGDATAEFRVSVLDTTGKVEKISVRLYGSVTVETAVQISRADVISDVIADVQMLSPTRLLITGRGYGTTNIVLTGGQDQQHLLEVSVELDLRRLNDAIRKIDPLSNVHADSVLGNILLTGTSSSARSATRIVELTELFLPPAGESGLAPVVQNHLDVAGEQQVLLRCVVAEVNRAAVRELGINGFLAGENFRDGFLVNQLGGINAINIGVAAGAIVTENVPFLTGSEGIPIGPASSISVGFPRVQMQLFIRAMADNSLLKVLAEPNLVAISGETATFLAGGEFPIPVPQGNQTVTIEFRKFGVRLNFTPVVRGHQRIRLRVASEVSELDFANAAQFQGFVIPGLSTRAAETTVDLASGETIAIAGLLSEQVRSFSSRVPGLGELPVLGALFRSVNFRRSLSELVILVTPQIVSPLDAHQAAGIADRPIRDPSDHELYFLGLLEGAEDEAVDTGTGSAANVAQPRVTVVSERQNQSVHGAWGYAAPSHR